MSQSPTSFSVPKKILLPTDFSASSNAALEAATDLAQHFHAELHLLHIIPAIPNLSGADFFSETSVLEQGRIAIEQRLSASKAILDSKGVNASFNIETGNDVVGNIMRVIERDDIDMIVISTHGLSGWRPVVFGSIAEKVIKLVQCPLLLLHSVTPIETSQSDESTVVPSILPTCEQ
jgi:nucleotide-binding universal stress UspA family protein